MARRRNVLKREEGYTLLIVLLLSSTLLIGVMTLMVSGGFAFRTMTTASQTSDVQYNADILANEAYQKALSQIYAQFQDQSQVSSANGMSLSIPLKMNDADAFVQNNIIQCVSGTEVQTIQGQSMEGQYYIQPMPTPPANLPNQDTHYLQAVGHIGNQTSVINFMASFMSVPVVPTSYNPYPPSTYGSQYAYNYDSQAVTQSRINTDLPKPPWGSSVKPIILTLASSSTATPVNLDVTSNTGYDNPLVYGVYSNLQALITGNVTADNGSALVIEGDLVSRQLTLQPNSIVKVYGNLDCSQITMGANSVLIVHGDVLCTGDVLQASMSSIVANGTAQVAGNLTIGSSSSTAGSTSGNPGCAATNAMFEASQGVTVAKTVVVNPFCGLESLGTLIVGGGLTDNGFVGITNDVNIYGNVTVGNYATLYADHNLSANSLALGTHFVVDVKNTATLASGNPGGNTAGTIQQWALLWWSSGMQSFDNIWTSSYMWTYNPWFNTTYTGGKGSCGGRWLDDDDDDDFEGWDSSQGNLSCLFVNNGLFNYVSWISGYFSSQGFYYGSFVQGTPPSNGPITLTALERLN